MPRRKSRSKPGWMRAIVFSAGVSGRPHDRRAPRRSLLWHRWCDLRGVRKEFGPRRMLGFGNRGTVVAVDDVSFAIPAGSTFGLVGESGSGKSTVARLMLKLERPTSGEVSVAGRDIFRQTAQEKRTYRRTVQAVLQDPYGALSPRLRVRDIIGEPLLAQGGEPRADRRRNPATPGDRRARQGRRRALPAPVQRRATPAHRDRARAVCRSAVAGAG